MSIIIKNSQLTTETIAALNALIELDINATTAFKLSRIIKELSSIVEDKLKMEKKILEKWVEKDKDGENVVPKDKDGNLLEGSVSITDPEKFTQEMAELMEIETAINFDKLNFEDMGLVTAKVKDMIKLDFLFN